MRSGSIFAPALLLGLAPTLLSATVLTLVPPGGIGSAQAQMDQMVVLLIKAALPPGAEVTTGRLSASGSGDASIDDLKIAFATPYLPQGAEPTPLFQGLKEIRIGKVTLAGLQPGADAKTARLRQLRLENQVATMAPSMTVRVGEAILADTTLADLVGLAFMGSMPEAGRSAGPVEARNIEAVDRANDFKMTLARASSGPTVGGVTQDSVAQDLAFESAEAVIRVGRMEVPRSDAGAMMALGQMGSSMGRGDEPTVPSASQALAMLQTYVQAMPAFSLSDILVDPVAPGQPTVTVEHVGYGIAPSAGVTPFNFKIEGVEVGADAIPPEIAAQLPALGPGPIRMGLTLDGNWDQANRRLAIEPLRLAVVDAATVEIAADFGGLPPTEALDALPPDQALQMLALTPLRSARVTVVDHGFIDSFVEQSAAEQGADRGVFAESLVTMANMVLGDGGTAPGARPDRRWADAMDKLRSFLVRPGQLTWTFAPQDPQPLALIGAVAAQRPASLLTDGKLDYTPPAP